MFYKRGSKIEVFKDYQEELGSLGLVKLIKFLRVGETYNKISDIEKNEELIPIYCYERWIVEFLENKYYKKGHRKQHNIGYLLLIPESGKDIIDITYKKPEIQKLWDDSEFDFLKDDYEI